MGESNRDGSNRRKRYRDGGPQWFVTMAIIAIVGFLMAFLLRFGLNHRYYMMLWLVGVGVVLFVVLRFWMSDH